MDIDNAADSRISVCEFSCLADGKRLALNNRTTRIGRYKVGLHFNISMLQYSLFWSKP